jgi:hypothetical protein
MSDELIAKIWLVLLCAPGVVPAAIFYWRHCKETPREGNRFPLGLYVVALLICAFVAFWGGTEWGVHFACRPSSGNLCGLLGFIVVGPLSSIIAVTVFSWLITYFPLQLKRLVLAGVLLSLLAGGYNFFRSFFFGVVMQHQSLYQYTLQSGNLDELHRFAPVVETQMRDLPVLKDVSLDSQLKSEAIVRGVKVPTMTISFSLAPKVALADAIVQIHDMEIRLALPSTITTSLAKAKWGRATSLSPPASSINANF